MNTSDEVRNFTVEADDDGIRVDRWFKRHLPQLEDRPGILATQRRYTHAVQV